MLTAPEFVAVKSFKFGDYPAHLPDCTDTDVVSAAMCSSPACDEFQPHKPFVGKYQFFLAGFCHNTSIRHVVFYEMLCSQTLVFFINNEGYEQAARNTSLCDRRSCNHGGGDSTLHVVATSTVKAIPLNSRVEPGNGHILYRHWIGVSAEDQSWGQC